MKRFGIALLAVFFLFSSAEMTFAKGGHYRGGRGRSHKGGSYKNKRTGNHYEKHGSSGRSKRR